MHGNAVRCDVIGSVHLCHGLHQGTFRKIGLEKLHLQCRVGRPVSWQVAALEMAVCTFHRASGISSFAGMPAKLVSDLSRGLIAARDKAYATTSSSAYHSAALAETPHKEVNLLGIIATPWQRVLRILKRSWMYALLRCRLFMHTASGSNFHSVDGQGQSLFPCRALNGPLK